MTLAVLLRQAGKDVLLLHGRRGSPEEGETAITVECSDGTSQTAAVPLRTLEQVDQLDGLILVTSKSFGNPDIARRLLGKTGQSPVVLLQNGLGIEQPFLDAGFPTGVSVRAVGDAVRWWPRTQSVTSPWQHRPWGSFGGMNPA